MSDIYQLSEDTLSQYVIPDEQRVAYRALTADYLLNFTDVFRVKSGVIQSADFVSGSAGWQLSVTNGLEANSGTFRGNISAATGTIGGFTIAASSLSVTSGGNTVTLGSSTNALIAGPTGSPSFTLTQAGALTLTSGTITGATVQTATSGARVSLDSTNGIRLFNSVPTQTASMALDGSGWFGTSTGFAWSTAGSATINGRPIATVQDRAESIFTKYQFTGYFTDTLTADVNAGYTITRTPLTTVLKSAGSSSSNCQLHSGYLGVDDTGTQLSWSGATSLTFTCAIDFGGTITSANITSIFGIEQPTPGAVTGTAHTSKHYSFIVNNNALYASCADGTTQTISSAIGGVTLTSNHSYQIIYTVGTNIKYYVDNALVATLSTNMPTGTTGATDSPSIFFRIQEVTTTTAFAMLLNNNYATVWVP